MLARRWLLYALTCTVVLLCEGLFYAFVHVKMADFYAELVGTPLVIVVVTVFIGGDATNTLSVAQRWERILERAWALIVLDVGLSFVQISGIQTMLLGASDAGDTIMGFLTLLLSAMLVYAEPFTALENDVQPITLLPFAILRSMMLGWVNVSRIFSLFSIQLAVIIAGIFVHQAALRTGADATVWIGLAFGTFVSAPLAALFTVAYLDTLSQERLATK
ncbi:MAG TPA: hypothetical protein VJP85_13320 [Candidatus Baltobacteraceae bacterium]|nr:hypothetical protein [Candidatus Baltobacteraceae bacterium]